MSTISTVSDIPGINNAVKQLQELGTRMVGEEFGFKDNDVSNIDIIIEALQELETERVKAFEKLETETIKASILRHKLKFYPEETRREIEHAVTAARESNAAQIKKLQDQLDAINKTIDELQAVLEINEAENAILHPDRDRVRAEHEEIISQLNQRLAEKANKQINLNETRDNLRDTNEKIVELEEGIVTLKEDLLEERLLHREAKKKLKDATRETTNKTRSQRASNMEKQRELTALLNTLGETNESISVITKSINRYDANRLKLEEHENCLLAQLEIEVKRNDELRSKSDGIRRAMEQNEIDYLDREKQYKGDIEKLLLDIDNERDRGERLEEEKEKVDAECRASMEVRKKDHERVTSINEALQKLKDNLASKAEDCGRMQTEIVDFDQRLIDLDETHQAVTENYQKQIEESRAQLASERKDRMELQDQRETVQAEIDAFRAEYTKYMKKMNKKINDGKRKHEALTKEGQELQKSIKSHEQAISTLKKDTAKADQEFKTMQHTLEKEISDKEVEMIKLEKQIREKEEILKIKEPEFAEFEAAFKALEIEYDTRKKESIALRKQKLGLDETSERAKRDLEKQIRPYEILREELDKNKIKSKTQISEHAAERLANEKRIYALGCKLKTLLEENDRFNQAIKRTNSDIGDVNNDIEANRNIKAYLEKEMQNQKNTLLRSWLGDRGLEQYYENLDMELVANLTRLLETTENREKQVGDIATQLNDELGLFTAFLDNVSTRRPKESKKPLEKPKLDAISEVAVANSSIQVSGPKDPLQRQITVVTDSSSMVPLSQLTVRKEGTVVSHHK